MNKENSMPNLTKKWMYLLSIVILFYNTAHSYAHESKKIPDGFTQYLVFIADGIIDTSDSSPVDGITNCDGMFCDGDYFQEVIMQRDSYEIEAFKNQAIEFFITRFGIDPYDPQLAGRIVFRDFMTNPQWGYRLQTFAGHKVDSDGWQVRDGGYTIIFTDPNGVPLGGAFSGHIAKMNQAIFFGNYNVLSETNQNSSLKKESGKLQLIMGFQSIELANILEDGSMNFRCEVTHEQWGKGLAFGHVWNGEIDGIKLQGRGRNVITFTQENE